VTNFIVPIATATILPIATVAATLTIVTILTKMGIATNALSTNLNGA
jgi:hypothetical protein